MIVLILPCGWQLLTFLCGRVRGVMAEERALDDHHRDAGWAVVDAMFRHDPYAVSRHQIDSFDLFVGVGIQKTLQETDTIVLVKDDVEDMAGKRIKAEVFIGRRSVSVDVPTIEDDDGSGGRRLRPMYPNDARLRDLTYGVNVYADVEIEYTYEDGTPMGDGKPVTFSRPIRLGLLPLMLHSRYCVLHGLQPEALREIGECPDDRGGYFIINGKEKVIVAQEAIVNNRVYVRRGEASNPDIAYMSYIRTDSEVDRYPRTATMYVRSPDAPSRPGCISVVVTKLGQVRGAARSGRQGDVPLFVLFRALGVESDRAILEHIVYDVDAPEVRDVVEFLIPSIKHAAALGVRNQRSALALLAQRVPVGGDLKQILITDLFPNMGRDLRLKALFLGHVVMETVGVVLGKAQAADRDDYVNKRVEVSGFLLDKLFRDIYLRVRNDITGRLNGEWSSGAWRASGDVRKFVNEGNLSAIFESERLTDSLDRSMKGNWGPDANSTETDDNTDKSGFVQDLTRVSLLSYVSHVRRVNQTLPPGAKLDEPRKMRASQWGSLCPVESPDGGNIGIMNHLTVLASISMGGNVAKTREAVAATGLTTALTEYVNGKQSVQLLHGVCKVMVNDSWIAVTHRPAELVAELKAGRRSGVLEKDTSIAWNIVEGKLHVHVDRGRLLRPLAVVPGDDGTDRLGGAPRPARPPLPLSLSYDAAAAAPGGPKLDYASLFKGRDPAVELVDVEEMRTLMVAMRPSDVLASATGRAAHGQRYTHCEIQPAAGILSMSACTIPLLGNNKAPRGVFALAQFKQAISVYSTAFRSRMDTHAYVLNSPQRPLINTAIADRLCHGHLFANGENVVVAVLTCTGYNMEDAILVNKDSVERGRLCVTCFETHTFAESAADVGMVVFANPIQKRADGFEVDGVLVDGSYHALGPDGLPTVGSCVGEGDVILGMVEVPSAAEGKVGRMTDRSTRAGRKHGGIVDAVATFETPSRDSGLRTNTCKVRMRDMRMPTLGDKLASRFAQKGVIGLLLPARDMPFCSVTGVVPDLIINPHGFPTRDTAGHLIECLLAKAAGLEGRTYACNPLEPQFDSIAEARSSLVQLGLSENGNEVMTNGRTGEQLSCDVFVGVNYYARLKHMVADKAQFRSSGRVNAITQQPVKSSGQSGGMRIGEMEQNAVVAHGMSAFLKESFIDRSDGHIMSIDADEGVPTLWGKRALPGSGVDGGPPVFANIQVPKAWRLLGHELSSMAIGMQTWVGGGLGDSDGELDDNRSSSSGEGSSEGDHLSDDGVADIDLDDYEQQIMDE